MPERPKQASYASKFEVRQTKPAESEPRAQAAAGPRSASSQPSAKKAGALTQGPKDATKPQSSGADGKMIRYRNLDDIPDGLPSSISSLSQKQKTAASGAAAMASASALDDYDQDDDNYDYEDAYNSASHSRQQQPPRFVSTKATKPGAAAAAAVISPRSYYNGEEDDSMSFSSDQSPTIRNQAPLTQRKSPSGPPPLPAELFQSDLSTAAIRSSNGTRPRANSAIRPTPPKQQQQQQQQDDRNVIHSSRRVYPPPADDIRASDSSFYARVEPSASLSSSSAAAAAMPALPYESNYAYNQPAPALQPIIVDKEKEKEKLFFSKEPRKVDFKPYSLGQYRQIKPKEYVEIGNMKPDLNTDELIAKRANLQRVKEFARNLKSFNDSSLMSQPKLPPASEQQEITKSVLKQASNRTKALEFAKNIPRPRVREETTWTESAAPGGAGAAAGSQKDVYGMKEEDAQKIAELERKHEDKKKQIEAIKRSMGMR